MGKFKKSAKKTGEKIASENLAPKVLAPKKLSTKGGKDPPKLAGGGGGGVVRGDKSQAKLAQKLKRRQEKLGKKRKEAERQDEEEFTLDLVKELGGDEEDFNSLREIEKAERKGMEGTGSGLKEGDEKELKSLIKSLNLKQYLPTTGPEEEDEEEEEGEEDEEEEEEEEEVELPQVKKKSAKQAGGILQVSEVSSTTEAVGGAVEATEAGDKRPEFHFIKTPPSRSYCVIKTEKKWYEGLNTPSTSSSSNPQPNLKYWLPKVEKYAQAAWDLEVKNSSGTTAGDKSEQAWLKTVLKSGTLSDKMAAYVVLVQRSPIHNFTVLETLVNMVTLKSRRPCLMAIDTLQQLFLSELLLESRKLRTFDKNPFSELQQLTGGNKDTRDRYLICWLFEERLKKLYQQFLDNLELVGKDTIEKTRVKVISCLHLLLAGNPEQEQVLLERLVNKLGDPVRGVAAKTMYHLTQLLEEHPAMKSVLVGEVERVLYRPNIAAKAQYYGICFLSQILLDKIQSQSLAAKLVEIYFSFFKLSIKKGEVETKLMSALLTGVNRAFPYASLKPEQLDSQLETMHKLVHLVTFNTAVQALTLLFQIMDSRDSVTDRYYSALYKKLLDPGLGASSKQVIFLNLLFNSMNQDPAVNRVKAFIKRLLQISEYQPANMICGLLFLVSELLRKRPELGSIQAILQSADNKFDLSKFDEDGDEEEHYADVKDEEDREAESGNEAGEEGKEDEEEEKDEKPVIGGWNFAAAGKGTNSHAEKNAYDPHCRNPLYSGAEKSPLWELESLRQHFHPSVALFATNLSENEVIKYPGDPLHDFTTVKFLDRFVFRNPKKDPGKNKPTTVLGKRNVYRPSGIKAIAPDSKEYLNRDIANVPNDELFLYKYFQAKAERKGETSRADEDDRESVTSDEFNQFLNSMGGASSRDKDFDDEDIDFAQGIKEAKRKRKSDEDDEDEDDNDDEEEEESDAEPDLLDGESNEGFQSLSDDDNDEFDEEGFGSDLEESAKSNRGNKSADDDDDDEFDEEAFGRDDDTMEMEDDDIDNEEEEEEEEKKMNMKSRKKMMKKGAAKFDPSNLQSLLADAEEYSHLLDENEESGLSSSYSRSDRAGTKQLLWEGKREEIMSGKNWKKHKQQKRKQLGNKNNKNGKQLGNRNNKSSKPPPKKMQKKR